MRRLTLAWILVPLAFTGCVDRIVSIRSAPPGAEVYLDGELRGTTPHDEHYSYYGTRELTLVKSGYRSHRRKIELNSPWWQIFPFDLVTDVLLPFTIADHVEVAVELEKEPPPADAIGETLKRDEEAREKAGRPADAPR